MRERQPSRERPRKFPKSPGPTPHGDAGQVSLPGFAPTDDYWTRDHREYGNRYAFVSLAADIEVGPAIAHSRLSPQQSQSSASGPILRQQLHLGDAGRMSKHLQELTTYPTPQSPAPVDAEQPRPRVHPLATTSTLPGEPLSGQSTSPSNDAETRQERLQLGENPSGASRDRQPARPRVVSGPGS